MYVCMYKRMHLAWVFTQKSPNAKEQQVKKDIKRKMQETAQRAISHTTHHCETELRLSTV